jgi:anti-anti-sigma factor
MVHCDVIERDGDHVVLGIRGDLSAKLMTDVLGESLEKHYVDDGVRLIRLNLSGVRFMDSYGVATLVGLRRASQDRGKRFVVEGATGQVRDKLQVTGVLGILERG